MVAKVISADNLRFVQLGNALQFCNTVCRRPVWPEFLLVLGHFYTKKNGSQRFRVLTPEAILKSGVTI